MLPERNRCWMKHRYREEWERCPMCGAPLRWMYDGDEWIPCDREPVRYFRDISGKLSVMQGRSLLDYCVLAESTVEKRTRLGLLPHVYSCGALDGWHGVKVERV